MRQRQRPTRSPRRILEKDPWKGRGEQLLTYLVLSVKKRAWSWAIAGLHTKLAHRNARGNSQTTPSSELRSLRFPERGSSPLDRTGAGTPLPSLPPPAARQTTRPPCPEAQPAHINYRSPDQASSIRTAARPSNLGGLLFIYLGL